MLLQEALTVCENGVHVRIVFSRYVHRTLPSVEFDIHFDGAVEKTSL
jgi:hypothetical protein